MQHHLSNSDYDKIEGERLLREDMGLLDRDAKTGEKILCVTKGEFRGWLCVRGAEDQWVTKRRATKEHMLRADFIESFIPGVREMM